MDASGVIAYYVMDGNRPLTATTGTDTTSYLYGLGAIGEETEAWAYGLTDGTNTQRQLTDVAGEVTYSARYTPWGDTLDASGTGNLTFGYFGGLMDTATGLIYVGDGQYYDPSTGRFLTRNAKPNQTNPYLPFDPTGAMLGPLGVLALVLGRKKKKSKYDVLLFVLVFAFALGMTLSACNLPQGQFTATAIGVPSFPLAATTVTFANGTTVNGLTPALPDGTPSILLTICTPSLPEYNGTQYDLTGYLAEAMTKHGRDWRVKTIAHTLTLANLYRPINAVAAEALWLSGYVMFYNLEASEKEWDIKLGIKEELRDAVVLCGKGTNCRWVDYSTPGNIHFGYVAGLAKISYFVAAIMGGVLEQTDLVYKHNLPLEPLYCFQNAFPGFCDNPDDRAAVDFGYELADKYGSNGLNDQQLRQELEINGLGRFQAPPSGFPIPHSPYPQRNYYGPDEFDQ